jgi:protoporphyrin/coproporphyrin ferrochelatase
MTRQALLLANLGSPASTSVADVRSYLNQFLMDPYVIDLPWPVRRLLVSLILISRPAKSAHAYQSIWWPEGSPLVEISRQLTDAVRPLWTQGPVELAMRYGEPSIETTLRKLAGQGVTQVTFAPLYPQFADSTTTTALVEARRVIAAHQLPIKLSVLQPFFDQPEYLDALAASVKPYLEQGFDHLLMSYHGLPERHLHKTDPTGSHCLKGADCCQRATGAVLDSLLPGAVFPGQQRLCRARRLAACTVVGVFPVASGPGQVDRALHRGRLDELAAQGVKKLLVMCPAFVADCIETLEEIGMRGREQFITAGGEELILVPCLNTQPQWVQALAQICARVPQAV